MKKLTTTAGILVLVCVLAVPVFAHRWGSGKGSGGPGCCRQGEGAFGGLTDTQRDQLGELKQKFFDETAELRGGIRAKAVELETLMSTSDPDAEKAKALQREISGLKAKMAEHKIDFELQARKIAPSSGYAGRCPGGRGEHLGTRRGFGPRMRGDHGQYQHNCPYAQGGGHGYGPCWN